MTVKHEKIFFLVIFVLVANNLGTSAKSPIEKTRIKRQIYIPTLDLGQILDTFFNVNIVWGFLYDVLATILGTRVDRKSPTQNIPLVITGTNTRKIF